MLFRSRRQGQEVHLQTQIAEADKMNKGIPVAIFLCCLWPLIVHFGILFGMRAVANRDWKNIQWQNLKLPWSKDDKSL